MMPSVHNGCVVPRWTFVARLALLLLLCAAVSPLVAQGPALTLLSKEGRRALPLVSVGNQEYIPLDEIATAFSGTVQDDRLAGGVTMSVGGRSIVLTPDQGVVSVAGRLVSLSAPVVHQGNRWLVPVDFLSRALALATGTRMDVRRPSRLVVVGDLKVPRVVARVEGAGPRTSVTFEISPAAPARVITPTPGQLDIEIDADMLDLTLPNVGPQELLQRLTPGESPTSIRIATGPRFGSYRASTEQVGADASRLTVELSPAGAETTTTPTPTPTPGPTELPTVVMPPPATGVRTIVLDPGHGGDETGAQGAGGALEKNVTLAIARRLKSFIESRLGLRVFLTRDDDRLMTLDERTAFANNQQADAFISIHANASLRSTIKGAEVYFLSLARVQSPPPPATPDVGQTVLPTLSGGMRAIDLVLWENAQERHLDRSSALATLIDQTLRTRVEVSPRGVQQAPLRVLVGANMPAVLVETGYLSNPQEERALASPDGQAHVAEALFDALLRFREQVERAATPATP
jgi:N-acetylmuramoyl-L-alanine amidase